MKLAYRYVFGYIIKNILLLQILKKKFGDDSKVTELLGHEKDGKKASIFYDDKSVVSVTKKDFMKIIARQ